MSTKKQRRKTMPDIEIRALGSLAKVFPNSAPPALTENKKLSALRGETISYQIAYLYKSDGFRSYAQMSIEASAEVNITVRRVRYMPGFIPSHFKTDEGYLSTDSGLYPDLLEPMDLIRVPLIPGIWQSLWISVEIPQQAKAGTYQIKMWIENHEGNKTADVLTEVEVIAETLPPLSIFHTRWFHLDGLSSYYGVEVFSEKHWEIIENFAVFAARHGINTLLTPVHTPPLDTEVGGERLTTQLLDITVKDGEYSFGFKKLERWINMCHKAGIEFFEIAHLFTQWGAKSAPKIMGIKDGVYMQLFGWDTDATGPEYTSYLQQMLPALTKKLFELGVSEKTIFHISDEPGLEHFDAYMNARKIVEPLIKGFRIIDALTNYDFYKKGAVSVPVPAVDHITPFLEGNVPELWCYYCCAQSFKVPNHFFMQPSYRNRILGVLLYKYDIAGFLHWGYNFYNSVHSVYPINPYLTTDADGAFPSGDAFVVYPGPDGKPLASLRLMVAQEAFNDLRVLRLLESLSGREIVLSMIDDGLKEPLKFDQFPQNEEYLLTLREKVNKKIREVALK